MNYKSMVITRKGPPGVLQLVEKELRPPAADEVRVRILYAGIGFTDVITRYSSYLLARRTPLVPGYEIVGIVDAVGAAAPGVAVGQRVSALTVHGGYAEYIYLHAGEVIPVPSALDSIEVVSLVLNFVTAYQMLHRAARMQADRAVLFTGASGGVGNALLQLGRLAGLRMYGTSSRSKHELVAQYGAIPIDYRSDDLSHAIRQREPEGLHAVFDSIGGRSAWQAYQLLRTGGQLVSYGITSAVRNGGFHKLSALSGYVLPSVLNLIPDGRRAEFYGITLRYRKDPAPFREDLQKLFQLLAENKIKPVIAGVFPLANAAHAHELLEQGKACGKLILRCSSD